MERVLPVKSIDLEICADCKGSGFSGNGTGYDAVCGTCGGQGGTPKLKKNLVRLLLDSGAYSAWARSTSIDIKAYIKYCKENARYIHRLIGLDLIPGEFRRANPSAAAVEESAKLSHINQQRMKDAGLKPIPVFHQGERYHWLEQMLRDGETYIGLSPSKFNRLVDKKRWLDGVFNILTDQQGRPLVKTHGFAATSLSLTMQYPWRSVDSTTWSLTPGYGQIIVPSLEGGKFDYTFSTRIIITGVQQKNESSAVRHFNGLGADEKYAAEKFINEVIERSVTQLRYGHTDRCRAMLVYYKKLNEQLYDVRHHRSGSLFGPDHFDLRTRNKALKPWHLIQYQATFVDAKEWSRILTDTGSNDRLVSFWFLKDKPNEVLEEYITTGQAGGPVRIKMKKVDWQNEAYRNRRALALHKRNKGFVPNPDGVVHENE